MRLTRSVCVGVCALVLVALPGGAQGLAPGDLLGSTGDQGSSLVDIDPATGAATFRATVGSLGPVTEIVFRPDGVLFGATGQGSSHIITIDPLSGAETLVGTHAFGAVNGLAFVGGTLYGAFFAPGSTLNEYLVTVDQSTAALTTIGIIGFLPVRGLAYDAGNDILYGVAPSPTGGGDVLLTIDRGTGAGTEVGPVGFDVGSLRFGPDGILYGGQVIQQEPNRAATAAQQVTASLLRINTATGAGTVIGDTGQPGLSGLAFVPGVAPTPGIPTTSGPGLTAFVVLLLAAAVVMLRRRAANSEA